MAGIAIILFVLQTIQPDKVKVHAKNHTFWTGPKKLLSFSCWRRLDYGRNAYIVQSISIPVDFIPTSLFGLLWETSVPCGGDLKQWQEWVLKCTLHCICHVHRGRILTSTLLRPSLCIPSPELYPVIRQTWNGKFEGYILIFYNNIICLVYAPFYVFLYWKKLTI